MNARTRPWIGFIFKMLALLAAIFAFIFFMKMQEEQSEIDRLRDDGVVSRALVTAKNLDKMTFEGRRGRSRSVDLQVLQIRHVPKSTVRYADYPAKVKEANLPVAPPMTGDLMKDSENIGVMFVSVDLYDKTRAGDMLTVVNTPYDPESPELVSDVAAWTPHAFYPRIVMALLLAGLFWFVGRRIGKAGVAAGAVAIASAPGTIGS